MILYHGSPHVFSQFDITKCSESCKIVEGDGIYFTPNYGLASSYGVHVYTVEVDTITDLTAIDTVYNILDEILRPWYGDYIQGFPYLQEYLEGLLDGKYSFNFMYRDLFNYLCESLYIDNHDDLKDALYNSISANMPKNYLYTDMALGTVAIVRDVSSIHIL